MDKVRKALNRFVRLVMSWNLKSLTIKFLVLAFLVGSVTSIFWYKDVYMTDERRFWSAIDNSMSTDSVVRTLTTGGSGNQVVQDNRFFYSPKNISESKVEFTNKSATVNTTVITEGVSTLTSQYSRYVFFDTNDAKSDGSIPNLDQVLGKWAGETADESQINEARLAYVSELVTLAIFGNYDPAYRQSVVDTFKSQNTYDINYNGVQESEVNGESVLVFPVSLGLSSYAAQLQDSFQRAGLGDFPPLNPENYRDDARINASFTVSKKTNNIVGIQFGDRNEVYTNYGVQKQISAPVPEFTPQELETSVQQQIQG